MPREELAAWLRLMLTPGVGTESARKLLAAFGLPQDIFEHDPAAQFRRLDRKLRNGHLWRSADYSGVVIEDNDLAAPLSGVSLQIIAPELLPAVLSDELGRFRINALPLAAAVTIEISWGDAVSTINHVVDYTTLFNPRIISLTG